MTSIPIKEFMSRYLSQMFIPLRSYYSYPNCRYVECFIVILKKKIGVLIIQLVCLLTGGR